MKKSIISALAKKDKDAIKAAVQEGLDSKKEEIFGIKKIAIASKIFNQGPAQ